MLSSSLVIHYAIQSSNKNKINTQGKEEQAID